MSFNKRLITIPPEAAETSSFNTVLYTGNGTTNQITDVGFQPDFVWVKRRNSAANHYIVDTVRGNGTSTYKNLTSEDVDVEGTTTSSGITNDTIVDGGFTMQGTGARTNANGSTYVAWCLKAGGKPTATNNNTSGAMDNNSVSIDGVLQTNYTPSGATLYPKKISANTAFGFSIVLFTGTGNSNNRVPHGLTSAPELIIFKNIDEARSWVVGSDGIGWTNTMKLEATETKGDRAYFDDVTPTSNKFEIYNGQANTANDAGSDFIAYCFHSVDGVSKVGSYTGNGSTTTGNTINVGFEASWIMIKKSSGAAGSSSGWFIIDNKRNTSDPWNKYLFANSNQEEKTTTASLTSVGATSFTVKSSGAAINQSGSDYIYYAIA